MMRKSSHLIQFPQSEPKQCPVCEEDQVQTSLETNTLTYGVGSDAVELTVTIPVKTCHLCGFRFTDDIAEEIEHEAVCQHLSVMTPKEIKAMRQRYPLSQSELSQITRIDEESLSRWEKGEVIQNAALDNLLYLLKFHENLDRLKTRYADNPQMFKQRALG
ncbi:MAG: type II TA system antitoxin MqsA family protein [Candidatus Parabeggiatoa sp.]|nr:type II TA system antitoxin MqsA family protein [Candidatus Parabeggiatoa sp.]